MGARDLLDDLAGLGISVRADGDGLIVSPRELLTDELRAALKEFKPDLLAMLTKPPSPEPGHEAQPEPAESSQGVADDGEMEPDPIDALPSSLQPAARVAVRLLLADPERAGRVVEWLGIRSADGDERRLCVECHHFGERGKVCRHPQIVAIQAPRDLGGLALTPQNCPGFAEKGGADAW